MYCCFSIHAAGVSLILYFYCKVSPEALHCGIYNETYIHRSGGIWMCIIVFLYMQWVSLILCFYCKVSSEVLHCVIMRPIYTAHEESGCVLLFFYTCSGRKFDSLFLLQSILRGTSLRYNETFIHRSGGIWMCIIVFLYMQRA